MAVSWDAIGRACGAIRRYARGSGGGENKRNQYGVMFQTKWKGCLGDVLVYDKIKDCKIFDFIS